MRLRQVMVRLRLSPISPEWDSNTAPKSLYVSISLSNKSSQLAELSRRRKRCVHSFSAERSSFIHLCWRKSALYICTVEVRSPRDTSEIVRFRSRLRSSAISMMASTHAFLCSGFLVISRHVCMYWIFEENDVGIVRIAMMKSRMSRLEASFRLVTKPSGVVSSNTFWNQSRVSFRSSIACSMSSRKVYEDEPGSPDAMSCDKNTCHSDCSSRRCKTFSSPSRSSFPMLFPVCFLYSLSARRKSVSGAFFVPPNVFCRRLLAQDLICVRRRVVPCEPHISLGSVQDACIEAIFIEKFMRPNIHTYSTHTILIVRHTTEIRFLKKCIILHL